MLHLSVPSLLHSERVHFFTMHLMLVSTEFKILLFETVFDKTGLSQCENNMGADKSVHLNTLISPLLFAALTVQ